MATTETKQMDLPMSPDQHTLAWEAPEFYHREKTTGWLAAIWVIAVVLSSGAFWYYRLSFTGILAMIVPLTAALALTTQGRLKPEVVRIVLDNQGVQFKGQLYQWDELKGFWFAYTEESLGLYLETTRRLMPIVSVQLSKTDPEAARTILLAHLPEHADKAELFSDKVARIMRF